MIRSLPKKVTALLLAPALWGGQAIAADVEWEGWSFDYSTNSNSSGLVLKSVDYNNKRILDKVSMPVMRVEYDNDRCGPYADILSSSRLRAANSGAPNAACNNQSVCSRTFTQNGESMLEVGANWQIGEYQIYQTYYFSANGTMDSRVYSRGLQCQVNHRHHAHWMFDFDIGDRENDRILRGDNDPQLVEFNDLTSQTAFWTIEDTESGDKVRLIPSNDDGSPDNFSKWDAAGRSFKSTEVGRWSKGARGEIGNNWMSPAENIDGQDLVMWYVSHLPHASSEGSSIWHASGPRVEVMAATTPPDPIPDPDPDPIPDPDPDPIPDPDPDPDPTPNPESILVNGGFDEANALAGWSNCGSDANTAIGGTSHQGAGALSISGGGCLYQEVPVNVGQEYTLSCQAARTGNLWTIMELSFLDSSYSSIVTEVRQINSGDGYQPYSITATAPASTVYGLALFYSEDQTRFDTCELVPGAGEPPVTDPDPDPDPVQGTNIIANGGFESSLTGWSSCGSPDLLSVSADADGGANALAVVDGGCMYQDFTITAGTSYSMNCRAKRDSAARYSSVSLSLMNSNYNSLETQEIPVTTANYSNYTATLTAPANSAYGSVVMYSEDPAVFDDCIVTAN